MYILHICIYYTLDPILTYPDISSLYRLSSKKEKLSEKSLK